MYDINELHKVHLEIANEIHRLCLENDIQYSLNGGTLLGAVRHQGFIPWDDDFDLGMTRENYSVFLQVIQKELSDEFTYISMRNHDLYSLPFLKILKKNTLLRETNLPKQMEGYGVFVDVFPYDTVPESKIKQVYQKLTTDFYFRLLLAKSNYNLELGRNIIKKTIYSIMRGLSFFVPRKIIINRLEKNSMRYLNTNSDELTAIGAPYGYDKEKISRNLFESLKLIPFENTKYFVFDNNEEVLQSLYGDYMKFPPIDERYNRHTYEFVKFNLKDNK